jgi:hypothetical protein
MAIGLAAVVGVVPASSAQQGKSAGTPTEAGRKTVHGISVAAPVGRVRVGPESMEGEPVYVRRTTVREGMTIVEVSTTPFMPVLPSPERGAAPPIVRPDQPASW